MPSSPNDKTDEFEELRNSARDRRRAFLAQREIPGELAEEDKPQMASRLDNVPVKSWSSTHHDPADESRPGAVLTTQEARQGETSGNMRLVLIASLVLAIIGGAIVYFNNL